MLKSRDAPPTVAEVMRTRTGAVRSDDTLARAAEQMESLRVREVPVVDDGGRLVGIVAQVDLLPHRGHFEWTPVAAVMSADPVTAHPMSTAVIVAGLLLAHHVNAVPIVVDGQLLGMVNRSDLLRSLVGGDAGL